MEKRIWLSVGASIYNEKHDEYLLIKRSDNGLWQLPGGVVEPGEELVDAVIREVKEETGVNVRVIRVTGVYESPNEKVISIVFACTYVDGNRSVSNESCDVQWVKTKKVIEYVDKAYCCRLLDARHSKVHLRTTDEKNVLKSI